ncbi:hybrid sensor histidine kinase/response regulator [Endozoicomonas sp. G2_1]|uniref:hybrid sensor histidine kinase/response regulator n=1 Tax=Endozoicomonas sp. G2_1 TaxID=2821091 RepID=UPI001AD9D3E7|nr:hybrid sensor histidine kinase/response regulator [Endozoicomonas sp. G2_1]MBO9488806.1 hybrid sensor histidine kinase/response regulator [Endozoicomonas sp. G2_1]
MYKDAAQSLGFHQVEVNNFIEREKAQRVVAIHKQTLMMQAIFIIACAWVFADVVDRGIILIWLSLQFLVLSMRFALTHWYFQIKGSTVLNKTFTTLSLCLCFINSLLWGASAFYLDFQQYPQESVFLITINLGIGIGSTGIGGYWLSYFLTYTVTFMTVFMVAFLVGVPEPNFLLAAIFLAFTLYLSKVVYVAYKGNIQNLLLRKQNEVLAKSRTDFLAAASHDLRQPLQALNLFLSALNNGSSDNTQILKQLKSSTHSLNALLNHMLDVSALDADSVEINIQPIAIDNILDELKERFSHAAEKKNIELVIPKTKDWVCADKVLLERALANLIDNAIKYTVEGQVAVSVDEQSEQAISISVRDSGIGISDEQQQHIFDEFYQVGNKERNSEHGVGLGLSIVKRICLLMNINILVDSHPESGSLFSLVLPKADKPATAPQPTQQEKLFDSDLNNICALVIEDNKNVREALCSQLALWGMEVLAAESEADIGKLVIEAPKPDIVLSDYRLVDCTGVEAIENLQALYGTTHIPSIIISGDTAPEVIDQVKASGYTLLHKPVKPAQLRAVIQRKLFQS